MNAPAKGVKPGMLELDIHSAPSPAPGSERQSRAQAQVMCLLNQTWGTTVATNVLVADTPAKRRRGLLGRPPLTLEQGIWIVPCESVHTFGMGYSIDLVYLNRRRRVVKIVEALAPNRVSFCLRARSVIELASGTVRRSGTQVGHQMALAASPESVSATSD